MAGFLLLLFGLPIIALNVRAQDTTLIFSRQNPSHMPMIVNDAPHVSDSICFRVRWLKPLPLVLEVNDTLRFECTILVGDGKMHSTRVSYSTSSGEMSFDISMQAPYTECNSQEARTMELGNPHPNPTGDIFRVTVKNCERDATLELYSLPHGSVLIAPIAADGEYTFSTRELPRGTYFLRLLSGIIERGYSVIVVEH